MFSKQTASFLFAVIAILSGLFVYKAYTSYQQNQLSNDKVNSLIIKFKEKFKNDSIYLAKANQLLIDKTSQKILDSISHIYEQKLETILQEKNAYRDLLIANNIKLDGSNTNGYNTANASIKVNTSNNVTTYSQLNKNHENNIANTPIKANVSSNVTTYSQLNKNHENNIANASIKATTPSNVTTYSQLKKKPQSSKNNSNVTSYSKLNTAQNKIVSKNTTKKVITANQSKQLLHNNYALDNAKNINNIDKAPIYPGCENNFSEKEMKNCFAINISQHILNSFNAKQIRTTNLGKGIHKVRVLFIIDENGNTKFGKIIGKWPHQISKKIKSTLESVPKMQPGKIANQPIPVKYSLLIPFIIQ